MDIRDYTIADMAYTNIAYAVVLVVDMRGQTYIAVAIAIKFIFSSRNFLALIHDYDF